MSTSRAREISDWRPPRRFEATPGSEPPNPYDRAPTPIFGDAYQAEGPKGPRVEMRRFSSQSDLLPFHLETPNPPSRANRARARALSMAQRVPLPQGVSGTVAMCSTVAFILGITTLIIGFNNRRMLQDATEQRHDPHSALMRMIYTVVLEAMRTNLTAPPHPIDTILPAPP